MVSCGFCRAIHVYAYTNICVHQQLTIKCLWFNKPIILLIASYCHVYKFVAILFCFVFIIKKCIQSHRSYCTYLVCIIQPIILHLDFIHVNVLNFIAIDHCCCILFDLSEMTK